MQLPGRPRLERIATALDVSLGRVLAQSGWAEAGRCLASVLMNIQPCTSHDKPPRRATDQERKDWWGDGVTALRIISAQLNNRRFQQFIDGHQNAVMWMATAEQGFSDFVLLVNRAERRDCTVLPPSILTDGLVPDGDGVAWQNLIDALRGVFGYAAFVRRHIDVDVSQRDVLADYADGLDEELSNLMTVLASMDLLVIGCGPQSGR